ncbi:MAG: HAD family hydrolase [Planctomycetota bacterium]|nr:HAD family hydrolase [Planctomycetota bacterium]
MRYLALACDYDGTLATGGQVPQDVVDSLKRLKASGRKLIMVTGREIPELLRVFPELELFDRIVAENGALLYHPATKRENPLVPRPPDEFVDLLKAREVGPISVGRVIVATWQPHETIVLQTIRDLGLELQVIFNKGAVMVLPSGVNKATGLRAALSELGLSAHNTVAVGDAENDHALCMSCEISAAVANALPTLKETADIVLRNHHGAGVSELIDRMLDDDLASVECQLTRHNLLIGHDEAGETISLPPHCCNVLVSAEAPELVDWASYFINQLTEARYQYCLIESGEVSWKLDRVPDVGSAESRPDFDSVIKLMEKPGQNCVVHFQAISPAERSSCLIELLNRLQTLRQQCGHPHWIILNGVDQFLTEEDISQHHTEVEFERMLFLTKNTAELPESLRSSVDTVITIGQTAKRLMEDFLPNVTTNLSAEREQQDTDAWFWKPNCRSEPIPVRLATADSESCSVP